MLNLGINGQKGLLIVQKIMSSNQVNFLSLNGEESKDLFFYIIKHWRESFSDITNEELKKEIHARTE